MNTIVISLGGEDYSVEYYKTKHTAYLIYSVQNLNGKEIQLTNELENEILDKILLIQNK